MRLADGVGVAPVTRGPPRVPRKTRRLAPRLRAAGCCARAASGQTVDDAAAAAPRRVMTSRRRMGGPPFDEVGGNGVGQAARIGQRLYVLFLKVHGGCGRLDSRVQILY